MKDLLLLPSLLPLPAVSAAVEGDHTEALLPYSNHILFGLSESPCSPAQSARGSSAHALRNSSHSPTVLSYLHTALSVLPVLPANVPDALYLSDLPLS